jgi:hypothetical protein
LGIVRHRDETHAMPSISDESKDRIDPLFPREAECILDLAKLEEKEAAKFQIRNRPPDKLEDSREAAMGG